MDGITYAIVGALVFLCAAMYARLAYRVLLVQPIPAVDIAVALVLAVLWPITVFAVVLALPLVLIRLLWKALAGV